MLFTLYSVTKDSRELLGFLRMIILKIELPVLKFLFRMAGAVQVVPRNSVHEPEVFNVFMSDLDFSLVAPETSFSFLFTTRDMLQKIFLNLGEIELYTPEEHLILNSNVNDERNTYWNRLFLLRKLNWQKKKLGKSASQYEKEKHSRALQITLRKLGTTTDLKLSEMFPEFRECTSNYRLNLPYYSAWLEHILSQTPGKQTITCDNENITLAFVSILPDNDVIPSDPGLKLIKELVLERELLVSRASNRLKLYRHNNSGAISSWIEVISKRKKTLDKQI